MVGTAGVRFAQQAETLRKSERLGEEVVKLYNPSCSADTHMKSSLLRSEMLYFSYQLASQIHDLSVGRAGFVGMKPVSGFHALLSLLKFLAISEQGASHFHFTLSPINYVADPV